MKRLIFNFFVLTALLSIFSTKAFAQEAIDDFRVDITINQDGSISVVEEILYNFGTAYKHGIFRNIPLVKENTEGKKFIMELKELSVTDELNNRYPFVTSGKNEIEVKIGDPDVKISGSKKYVISYKILGGLTYFDDFDEIYWNAIGTEWEVPINNAFINVNLPEGVRVGDSEIKFACYTGVQGSKSTNCEGILDGEKVAFKNTLGLGNGDGLTIAVSFPKGFVSVVEPTLYRRSLKEILIYVGIGLALLVGNVVLPIRKVVSLVKEKSYFNKNKKIVSAWFDPPKRPDGSLFSPGETFGIVEKLSPKLITAEIVYLAQKGYIKIIEDGKKDFAFEKLKEADASFTDHQRTLYKALFAVRPRTTTKEMKRSYTLGIRYNDMVGEVYKELVALGFSEKNIKKLREGNGAKAFFSLFLGGIVGFVVYSIASSVERKLTDAGIQAYSEAKSLKNFLSSQKDQLEFQAKNQMFFEKLLPYATAFGVEKVWAERFKGITLQKPDWYEGDFNAMQFAVISSAVNKSVMKSVASANRSSSSGFSSGSGGGGFSGGGGGGGGGGSW